MPLLPLLRAAASGDPGARERLLAELYPSVATKVHLLLERDYRTHNAWVVPLFSTNDIVQELFIGLISELSEEAALPETEEAFGAFLAARIKNRIVDRLRFHSRQKRDARRETEPAVSSLAHEFAASPAPSASQCAALDERMSLWQQALAELHGRDAELWRLRFDAELPFETIAVQLGYKNAESARAAFRALRARIAVHLRRLGLGLNETPG